MITLHLSIDEAKSLYDRLEELVIGEQVGIVESLLLSLSYRIEAADAV